MIDWAKPKKWIQAHSRFLISTHIHADGDAVGSAVALRGVLRAIGKSARIVHEAPVPRIYRFLDEQHEWLAHEPERTRQLLAWCDAVIVVDTAEWSRLGEPGIQVRRSGRPLLCIDHHRSDPGFATIDAMDTSYCATGAMVLELAQAMGARIDRAVSEALFIAIATDTGWFRFGNTTAACLRACGDLVELGARPHALFSRVYEHLRPQRMGLLVSALATLAYESDGRIAWFKITRDMFAQSGADEEDVEGFVDLVRGIKGVEVILLFREGLDGKTKVSLRAKGDTDVCAIAAQFGGGGHAAAAGLHTGEPLDEVIAAVLAAAQCALAATTPQ